MNPIERQVNVLKKFSAVVQDLSKTGVIRSSRYTGDIGEWYVEQLYGGEMADNQTQKGWDVLLKNGEKLQVKTQSYDKGNRWNYFNSDTTLFDRFILVILTDNVIIRDLYNVPSDRLNSLLTVGKEEKPKYKWDDLKPWRIDTKTLPGYENLSELIEA